LYKFFLGVGVNYLVKMDFNNNRGDFNNNRGGAGFQRQVYKGEWQCAKCGAAITELPF